MSRSQRFSSARVPGVRRSKGCRGLRNGGRTVCGGTAAVRAGEGSFLPPCNRVTPNPGTSDAKKRGRIEPWGRAGCNLLQPIAPACKAGDVSRRSFSPLGRSFSGSRSRRLVSQKWGREPSLRKRPRSLRGPNDVQPPTGAAPTIRGQWLWKTGFLKWLPFSMLSHVE